MHGPRQMELGLSMEIMAPAPPPSLVIPQRGFNKTVGLCRHHNERATSLGGFLSSCHPLIPSSQELGFQHALAMPDKQEYYCAPMCTPLYASLCPMLKSSQILKNPKRNHFLMCMPLYTLNLNSCKRWRNFLLNEFMMQYQWTYWDFTFITLFT